MRAAKWAFSLAIDNAAPHKSLRVQRCVIIPDHPFCDGNADQGAVRLLVVLRETDTTAVFHEGNGQSKLPSEAETPPKIQAINHLFVAYLALFA
jgi:hypothetical protein